MPILDARFLGFWRQFQVDVTPDWSPQTERRKIERLAFHEELFQALSYVPCCHEWIERWNRTELTRFCAAITAKFPTIGLQGVTTQARITSEQLADHFIGSDLLAIPQHGILRISANFQFQLRHNN
jgi:predicted Zn-dependent protease